VKSDVKVIPVVGGVCGGVCDAYFSNAVGKASKEIFLN